jgi:membrane protease YdiL (CAAX protease family)
LINSIIFAAIHPQGWLAIPALTVIAFNLSLIRQWRGSLIGPIVAHGVHNGILVTIAILLMKN